LDASSQVPADEPLVGVVCSDGLRRGDDPGYGLLVAHHRILGCKKPESMESFESYLAPGTAESGVRAARAFADRLLVRKDFQVRIGDVGQILFKRPSLFSGGYVIVKTADRSIRIDAVVTYANPRITETCDVLSKALYAAVGWRLSIGKTETAVLK
jgi:hypothetical protein